MSGSTLYANKSGGSERVSQWRDDRSERKRESRLLSVSEEYILQTNPFDVVVESRNEKEHEAFFCWTSVGSGSRGRDWSRDDEKE